MVASRRNAGEADGCWLAKKTIHWAKILACAARRKGSTYSNGAREVRFYITLLALNSDLERA